MQREDGIVFPLHYDQVGSLRVVAGMDGYVIKGILSRSLAGPSLFNEWHHGSCSG